MNSFQKLEQEEMTRAKPSFNGIKSNLDGSMSFIRFLGDAFELYLPKILSVILAMFGVSDSNDRSHPAKKEPHGL